MSIARRFARMGSERRIEGNAGHREFVILDVFVSLESKYTSYLQLPNIIAPPVDQSWSIIRR